MNADEIHSKLPAGGPRAAMAAPSRRTENPALRTHAQSGRLPASAQHTPRREFRGTPQCRHTRVRIPRAVDVRQSTPRGGTSKAHTRNRPAVARWNPPVRRGQARVAIRYADAPQANRAHLPEGE